MTTLLLIAAVFVSGFLWANSKIVVLVDGKQISASALAPDPKDVLSAVGVHLGPRDEYRVEPTKPVKPALSKCIVRFP